MQSEIMIFMFKEMLARLFYVQGGLKVLPPLHIVLIFIIFCFNSTIYNIINLNKIVLHPTAGDTKN